MDKNLLELFRQAGLLKTVKRTGWALKGIEEVESVADHSWRVALMCALLGKEKNLDISKVVLMALIHDLGEIEIGDLRWESGRKVIGDQKEKHADEEKSVKKLFKGIKDSGEYVALWQEFNEQKTKEARFVKQVDKLEMAFQALEYEQAGCPKDSLNEFWENAEKYLEGQELEGLFRLLQEKRSEI